MPGLNSLKASKAFEVH